MKKRNERIIMKPLRAAVIGTGNMGKFHVRNYLEMEDTTLVAIADLNEETGTKLSKEAGCKYYKDYKEMIEKEKPDLVSIAVPTKYHTEVAIYCLSHKIPTILEKPIADTVENAKKIVAASKKSKTLLTIGHIERFNPAVIKLKEIIDSGKLGQISSIIARRVGVSPPQIKDADVIIDLAVHDIDIINYLLEKLPDKVTVNSGKSIIDNRNDFADIFLRYGNTSAMVQVNWITPVKIRKLNVTGSKGYAELDYITQELTMFESNYNKEVDNYGDLVIKFGTPTKIELRVQKEQPLRREILSFIDNIKNKTEPLVTKEQAIQVLRIVLQSKKAAR